MLPARKVAAAPKIARMRNKGYMIAASPLLLHKQHKIVASSDFHATFTQPLSFLQYGTIYYSNG